MSRSAYFAQLALQLQASDKRFAGLTFGEEYCEQWPAADNRRAKGECHLRTAEGGEGEAIEAFAAALTSNAPAVGQMATDAFHRSKMMSQCAVFIGVAVLVATRFGSRMPFGLFGGGGGGGDEE